MPDTRTTSLLRAGAFAGPLYIGIGTLEVLLRPGFDIRRHALSLMSNGSWGWIQVATFVLSGVLVLLGVYGLGLIGAGLFVADPMDGFPLGTPPGPPTTMSWHGPLHFMAGGVGFLGLIAGCALLAYRFRRTGERHWARYSATTGALFLAGFAGIASGARSPWINLGFTAAVILAWVWLTQLYLKVRAEQG